MNRQNHEELEKEAIAKAKKREKKKKPKMRVTGAQVKILQKIIANK